MVEARLSRNRAWLKRSVRSLLLLGGGIVFPVVWLAHSQQSSSPAPWSATLTEQQRAGRNLLIKNCSICHLPLKTESKSTVESATVGPVLKGLFRREKPLSEQDVRTFILRGVPQRMPGFQYGLEPKEIDDIIAYLKTL